MKGHTAVSPAVLGTERPWWLRDLRGLLEGGPRAGLERGAAHPSHPCRRPTPQARPRPGPGPAASGGSRWDTDVIVIVGKRRPEARASKGQWLGWPSRGQASGRRGARVSGPREPPGDPEGARGQSRSVAAGWERSPQAGGPRAEASLSPHPLPRAISGVPVRLRQALSTARGSSREDAQTLPSWGRHSASRGEESRAVGVPDGDTGFLKPGVQDLKRALKGGGKGRGVRRGCADPTCGVAPRLPTAPTTFTAHRPAFTSHPLRVIAHHPAHPASPVSVCPASQPAHIYCPLLTPGGRPGPWVSAAAPTVGRPLGMNCGPGLKVVLSQGIIWIWLKRRPVHPPGFLNQLSSAPQTRQEVLKGGSRPVP